MRAGSFLGDVDLRALQRDSGLKTLEPLRAELDAAQVPYRFHVEIGPWLAIDRAPCPRHRLQRASWSATTCEHRAQLALLPIAGKHQVRPVGRSGQRDCAVVQPRRRHAPRRGPLARGFATRPERPRGHKSPASVSSRAGRSKPSLEDQPASDAPARACAFCKERSSGPLGHEGLKHQVRQDLSTTALRPTPPPFLRREVGARRHQRQVVLEWLYLRRPSGKLSGRRLLTAQPRRHAATWEVPTWLPSQPP